MKRKILLILLVIFLCSGCTAKYDLHINYDGTFSEKIEVTETEANFKRIGSTAKDYVNINNEIFEKSGIYGEYKRNIDFTNNGVLITSARNYIPFKDFNYSSIAKNGMFRTITFEEDEEKKEITLNATNIDVEEFFRSNPDAPTLFYDKVELTITSDLKILKSNADSVDTQTGTHKWVFDEQNSKEVLITFSTKRDIIGWSKFYFTRYKTAIIIIGSIVVAIALISVIIKQRYQNINKV